MKKQKICIIGGSLTGLTTAISLAKLNIDIDLIIGSNIDKFKSNRTIGISENNYKFLENLNIAKSLKNISWASTMMKLYAEVKNTNFLEIFEINKVRKKNIMHMISNEKIMQYMMKKIKKIKCISVHKNENIKKIENFGSLKGIKLKKNFFKYNLIIICTGGNSDLVNNIFNSELIKKSYSEVSLTTTLKHTAQNNNIARQIFLKDEILALLPTSKSTTSVVWTVKKNCKEQNIKNFKKKIKLYTKKYLKNLSFKQKIESKDLNFIIRKNYYKNRILLFGDALHVIHPFVGQGFNMVLRDLSGLQKILSNKLSLGLDIGNNDVLSEFSKNTKPQNFIFCLSTDVLKSFFSTKNKYLSYTRNGILKNLNKNQFIKKIFFDIANEGFKI
jgi:2-octaprenyl-6-methoxyphenol hydroxylase